MTAAEAQPWLDGLKSVTGLIWNHRVDHMARDEFRTIVAGFELHLWVTGRWAVYGVESGNGQLNPAKKPFDKALDQLQRALQDSLRDEAKTQSTSGESDRQLRR